VTEPFGLRESAPHRPIANSARAETGTTTSGGGTNGPCHTSTPGVPRREHVRYRSRATGTLRHRRGAGGDRNARQPLPLDIRSPAPDELRRASAQAKEAWARRERGRHSTTTRDGGMTPEERGGVKYLVYQYLPSRYGRTRTTCAPRTPSRWCSPGRKPGGGGMLLGQKISDRVAACAPCGRHRPAQRLPAPDWTGPDDLTSRSLELREITDWANRSTSRSAPRAPTTT